MPEPGKPFRPSYSKIWLPLTADENVGMPLAEWAYVTPWYRQGLKASQFHTIPAERQREVMSFWFVANHREAKGPYFGFAEAALQEEGGVTIAGFDQAPFFNGGYAPYLLREEFGTIVDADRVQEAATPFHGLWERRLDAPLVAPKNSSPEEKKAVLLAALAQLEEGILSAGPEHGGIGHNQPDGPDSAISADDRATILRVASETRLAVLSEDYTMADEVWDAAKPVFDKIRSTIEQHSSALFDGGFSDTGKTVAIGLLASMGALVGLWSWSEVITVLLARLSNR